jgi:hypothetical protein
MINGERKSGDPGRTEVQYLPMLRRTVAPCPSGCDSARSFLTTALGFSNGTAEEEEEEEEDDDMTRAGGNKTVGMIKKEKEKKRKRKKQSSRRIGGLVVVLVGRWWCLSGRGATGRWRRRWWPILATAEV